MSRINFAPNLFLGLQELERWWDFTVDDGYKAIIKKAVKSYGFIVKDGEVFDSLKVVPGSLANKLTVKAGSMVDSNLNILSLLEDAIDEFTVPDDGQTYRVIATYAESTEEEGTVSIDLAGNVTGVGTKFTEVLRGAPYHQVVVKFTDANTNTGEYEILEVISDTQARLNVPHTLSVENNLKYAVVGTHSPGIIVGADEKYPYRYNSISLSLSLSPVTSLQLGNTHFYLATVVSVSGSVTITDTRGNYIFEFVQNGGHVNMTTHSFFGIKDIRWAGEYTDKGSSLVSLEWGFKIGAGDWTVNSISNLMTLNAGSGGIYATINAVMDDGFNGWRVYFANGKYTNVVDTRQVTGSVQLDIEDSSLMVAGEVIIAPPADFIVIKTESVVLVPPPGSGVAIAVDPNGNITAPAGTTVNSSNIEALNRLFVFPASIAGGRIEVPYTGVNRFRISIKFVLGSSGQSTEWFLLKNGAYRNESNYDSNGVFLGNPVLLTSTYQSTVALRLNADNHDSKKAWLNKTNRFTALNSLAYGSQVDNTSNLLAIGDTGNSFPVNVVTNDLRGILNKPIGTQIFLAPNAPMTLKVVSLTPPETLAGYLPLETTVLGSSITVTQDDIVGLIRTPAGTWKVWLIPYRLQLNQVVPPLGTVLMWEGTIVGNFDATGLGISEDLSGFAICNGLNGTPDLRGRFIVGAINDVPATGAPALSTEVNPVTAGNTNFEAGDTGGLQKVALTIGEMPEHNHVLTDPGHNHNDGDFDVLLQVTGTDTQTENDSTANEPDIVNTGTIQESETGITLADTGGGEMHENLPPYYTLIYIKRIA